MHVLVQLAYDGAGFSGAAPAEGRRTVVGELAAALSRLGVTSAVDVMSRTDAGVHALANVASFASPRDETPDGWLRALDRHLPDDLRAHGVARVDALPGAGTKTYAYTLDLSPGGDPFLAARAWRVAVEPARLEPLARALVGRLDFEPFRRRDETRDDLVRTVHAAAWSREGDRLVFRITGDGFPYRGVRSLVGAMVAVARGASSEDALRRALAGERTDVTNHSAPARGLCLERLALTPEPRWHRPG